MIVPKKFWPAFKKYFENNWLAKLDGMNLKKPLVMKFGEKIEFPYFEGTCDEVRDIIPN